MFWWHDSESFFLLDGVCFLNLQIGSSIPECILYFFFFFYYLFNFVCFIFFLNFYLFLKSILFHYAYMKGMRIFFPILNMIFISLSFFIAYCVISLDSVFNHVFFFYLFSYHFLALPLIFWALLSPHFPLRMPYFFIELFILLLEVFF